jgi:hypothetical protein
MGTLVSCREEQDRIYFRVNLEEFVYPRDFAGFNQIITRSLGPMGLPCLKGNDPCNTDDGYYAIKAGSLFTSINDFHWGEDAWKNSVEQLYKTQAFTEIHEQNIVRPEQDVTREEFVFVRCEICEQSSQGQRIIPKLRRGLAVFDLIRGIRYEFLLSYRYPPQITNTSHTANVEAKFGENLRALGSTSINIDSYSNSVSLPFATKRHLEDNEDGVSFEFTSNRPKFKLIGPDARLLFKFKESKPFWIFLIILLIAFTTLSVIIGTDFAKISPLTICNIIKAIWVKILAGFIQALVLFFLFRLMGKKFL